MTGTWAREGNSIALKEPLPSVLVLHQSQTKGWGWQY